MKKETRRGLKGLNERPSRERKKERKKEEARSRKGIGDFEDQINNGGGRER